MINLTFGSQMKYELKRYHLTLLALEQSSVMSGYWDKSQRDCSGLVRFLFRNSIFNKNDFWINSKGEKVDYLGASELISYNFHQVSQVPDFNTLKTGDIFVYYQQNKEPTSAWHLMVYVSPPRGVQQRGMLIYHNGQIGPEGAVKKVWLEELNSEVAGPWRPIASNTIFKGIYRWNGFKKE